MSTHPCEHAPRCIPHGVPLLREYSLQVERGLVAAYPNRHDVLRVPAAEALFDAAALLANRKADADLAA